MLKTIILALTLAHSTQAECPEGCADKPILYDDLKCKPIYEKPTDCCPIKYDCSQLNDPPAGKCYFQGKYYDRELPEDTYATCNAGCSCSESKIRCAILDCPEWLGIRPPPGCQSKYELDKCCSVGQICPDAETPKCEVDGKTYHEGERFSPKDKNCWSCVCQKGFKGEFVEPFCRKNKCHSEIRHYGDIMANCAPAYSSASDCCPYEWICPEPEDKIISESKGKINSDLQCKYGSKLLNIGDHFERMQVLNEFEKTETKCECLVPPLASCVMKHVYDVDKAPEHIKPHIKKID